MAWQPDSNPLMGGQGTTTSVSPKFSASGVRVGTGKNARMAPISNPLMDENFDPNYFKVPDAKAQERAALIQQLQQQNDLVKRNTTGSFLHNVKIAGGKAAIHSAATAGREVAQQTARVLPEIAATVQQKVTGKPTALEPNKAGQFLFGKEPIQSIQEKGVGAEKSHPGGFHIPGTKKTLSPKGTGLAETLLSAGVDIATILGVGKGVKGKVEKFNATTQGAKTTAKNVATQNILEKAREPSPPPTGVTPKTPPTPVKTQIKPEGQGTLVGKNVNKGGAVSVHPKIDEIVNTLNNPATAKPEMVDWATKSGLLTSKQGSLESGAGFISKTPAGKQLVQRLTVNPSKVKVWNVPQGDKISLIKAETAQQAADMSNLITGAKGRYEKAFASNITEANPKISAQILTPPKPTEPTITSTKALKTNVAQSKVAPVEAENVVKVPQEQLPVGTGKEKVSRLEARMQGALNNLTDEEKSSLSTYNTMSKQENISAAASYVDKHPDEALQVLKGEVAPPKGIAHNSVFLALDAKAVEDGDLARKLASLRSTRYGQELSLLTEANVNSPVKHISDIQKVRIEAAQRRMGRPISQAIKKETDTIKSNIKSPTRQDWNSFVESLRC